MFTVKTDGRTLGTAGSVRQQRVEMMKRHNGMMWAVAVVFMLGFGAAWQVQAQDKDEKSATLGQKVFYYFPNLALDFLDIFHVGIAVGPGFGGEVACTEKAQLGKYSVNEEGIAWYGSSGGRKLVTHSGKYKTTVVGTDRTESKIDDSSRFMRGSLERKEWDVRAEVALGLVHPYFGIDIYEIGDFLCGFVGYDLKGDNLQPSAYSNGDPARKLGRGVSNLAFGVWEIPKNVYSVKKGGGSAAAITWGVFRGFQRFVVREVVGAYEIITFPTGSKSIIEPEFPFDRQVGETEWRVRQD